MSVDNEDEQSLAPAQCTGVQGAYAGNARLLRRAPPNPSLKLTCYGMRRKPGLQYASYPYSPGLRRTPPQAA